MNPCPFVLGISSLGVLSERDPGLPFSYGIRLLACVYRVRVVGVDFGMCTRSGGFKRLAHLRPAEIVLLRVRLRICSYLSPLPPV